MPRYSAFREETRKAYEQIYLVNALSTMHVWSVKKDDRQQRNNTFFILLPLELLPDHYILLLLAGVSRRPKKVFSILIVILYCNSQNQQVLRYFLRRTSISGEICDWSLLLLPKHFIVIYLV